MGLAKTTARVTGTFRGHRPCWRAPVASSRRSAPTCSQSRATARSSSAWSRCSSSKTRCSPSASARSGCGASGPVELVSTTPVSTSLPRSETVGCVRSSASSTPRTDTSPEETSTHSSPTRGAAHSRPGCSSLPRSVGARTRRKCSPTSTFLFSASELPNSRRARSTGRVSTPLTLTSSPVTHPSRFDPTKKRRSPTCSVASRQLTAASSSWRVGRARHSPRFASPNASWPQAAWCCSACRRSRFSPRASGPGAQRAATASLPGCVLRRPGHQG